MKHIIFIAICSLFLAIQGVPIIFLQEDDIQNIARTTYEYDCSLDLPYREYFYLMGYTSTNEPMSNKEFILLVDKLIKEIKPLKLIDEMEYCIQISKERAENQDMQSSIRCNERYILYLKEIYLLDLPGTYMF